MKKIYLYSLIGLLLLFLFPSCESYLDIDPNMGISEEDVYKDYASIRGFMDKMYDNLENIHEYGDDQNGTAGHENGRSHISAISDELSSMLNSPAVMTMNSGNWLIKADKTFEIGVQRRTVIAYSFQSIRIANRIIRDIDKVPGLTDIQRNEILGQTYFLRAWYYFNLMKRYGGMPILDKVYVGDGDEDVPRVTYHESHDWMYGDLETALGMLPDKWDDKNVGRATKAAALALMTQTRLFDASPLMQNSLTTLSVLDYDKNRAKLAAQSATATLKYIAEHSADYHLMGTADYKNIFYWLPPNYTQPEFLWYNRDQASNFSRYIRSFWLPSEYAVGTGNDAAAFNAPNQNMVKLYEKKGTDGKYYPIDDSKAGYDAQNPFVDRDPRFRNNILVPGEKWGTGTNNKPMYITSYLGGQIANTLLTNQYTNKRQHSGYFCKKFIWEGADNLKSDYTKRVITVYIRVAEIYLDLAEASFEATGSATAVVDGCELSALQALNIVRNRAGIGDLPDEYTTPDKFREAYRRERAVELMFENHRWWDIRRWMIMHKLFETAYPITGIVARPIETNHASIEDKSTLHFTYEEVPLIPEVRKYGMRNYWYPFCLDDAYSLDNLVQNPGW